MPDVTPETVIEAARKKWPDFSEINLHLGEIKVRGDQYTRTDYPTMDVIGPEPDFKLLFFCRNAADLPSLLSEIEKGK